MRLFLLPSFLYLLIVTFYMVNERDHLRAKVKSEFTASFEEQLQEAKESRIDSGECAVASDKNSNDICLSTDEKKDIKTAVLAAQSVYPLDPGILDTTLSICNPRKSSCF